MLQQTVKFEIPLKHIKIGTVIFIYKNIRKKNNNKNKNKKQQQQQQQKKKKKKKKQKQQQQQKQQTNKQTKYSNTSELQRKVRLIPRFSVAIKNYL